MFPFQFFFQNKTPYQLAEEEGHSDVINVYKVMYLLNKYIQNSTVEQIHTFMEDFMQQIAYKQCYIWSFKYWLKSLFPDILLS